MVLDRAKPAADFAGEVDALVDDQAGDDLSVFATADIEFFAAVDFVAFFAHDEGSEVDEMANGAGAIGLQRVGDVVGIAGVGGVERFGQAGEAGGGSLVLQGGRVLGGWGAPREGILLCSQTSLWRCSVLSF